MPTLGRRSTTAAFTNNGRRWWEWIPFRFYGGLALPIYHRVATMIDPTTGLPRLIFGNDQGVWSVLDNNGNFETQIGSADQLPNEDRNGNLPDHPVLLRCRAAQ